MMTDEDLLLNHYTNAAGLEGITRNEQLWCTGVRHMNDRSEYLYVHETALQMLEDAARTAKGEEVSLWQELIQARTVNLGNVSTTEILAVGAYYLGSFSARHDDLNQYRVYGGKTPYALRFSKDMLQQLADAQGFKLIECDYSTSNLRRELETLVDEVRQLYAQLPPSTASGAIDSRHFTVARAFWDRVVAMAPRFKHGAYKDEQEWRLVSPHKSALRYDEIVKFRVNNERLSPYIEFSLLHETLPGLRGPFGKPVVLQEVRLGEPVRNFVCTEPDD